ncbi:MAG: VWA domain-containing protein [Myxococcales bacterium]
MLSIRRPTAFATAALSALLLLSCGRTEPLRYRPRDGGEAPDAALACVEGVLSLKRALPEVVLVLDRSTSMDRSFAGGRTRWESLTRALAVALPPVDQTMELGALPYPDGQTESCAVALAPDLFPALGNAQRILDRMRSLSPGGHTPTATAVGVAAVVAQSTRAAKAARALVLATDGAPNCNASLSPSTCSCASGNRCDQAILCLDDERTIGAIALQATLGLPTYVIGIQESSSDFIEVLDRMAIAGGRPLKGGSQSYYAATSQSELEQAFVSIRDQVGSCTWLTSSVPDDDGSIEVKLDGVVVPHDLDAKDGWAWSNRDNGELTFYGSACERAATSASPVVESKVLCARPDAGE